MHGVARDLDLIRRVFEGEDCAICELFTRIDPIVGRCLANARAWEAWVAEIEEDLRQQFDLMLIEGGYRILRSFRGRSSLTTWIYVVATRFVRHRLRRVRSERACRVDASALQEHHDAAESLEAVQIRREEIEWLQREVDRFDMPDRMLLTMSYEQELTAGEIGRMFGLKPSAVRMRKKRLLARLAEATPHA